ncbi:hypothetical protein [Paracoccus alkenifer]|uniref:hypothetical protein n=1 Tax=Paracoccus alkenifer TaxID=65735 RepID=UPI0015A63114|nr:hypothetical protein [Paracoccus alkenifer]
MTVHDSMIAPYTHSMEIQAVMRYAAADVARRELPVVAEPRGLDEWQGEPRYVQQDFQWWRKTERSEAYLARLAA